MFGADSSSSIAEGALLTEFIGNASLREEVVGQILRKAAKSVQHQKLNKKPYQFMVVR
jgi:hypothetical protein